MLLALLFVSLAAGTAAGQSGSSAITVAGWISHYGPEDWKDGLPGTWDASLGTAVDVLLEVPLDAMVEGVLSDGSVEVVGAEVARDGERVTLRFDVDGQRALPGQAALLPLAPGTWVAELEAYEAGPGPLSPPLLLGRTQAVFDASAVQLSGILSQGAAVRLADVPETVFPHLRDVAAGPDLVLPWSPVAPGMLRFEHESHDGIGWALWRADALLASQLPGTPGGPTPLDPVTESPLPLATAFTLVAQGTNETWVGDRAVEVDVAPGLYVSAATGSGSSAVVVVPVANVTPQIVAAYPVGFAGLAGLDVTVDLDGAAAVTGSLVALTAGEDGARLLSRAPLVVLPDGTARATLEANALRAAGVPAVRLVAFLQDSTGNYVGHAMALRGLDAALQVPLLGVDEPAEIGVQLTNVAAGATSGHAVNASVTLWAGDVMLGTRNVTVNPGATVQPSWSWTPSATGAIQFRAGIETGDLAFDVRKSATVLDEDAYRSEQAEWYEPARYTTPAPSPLVALALVVAALSASRGRTRNG